VAKDLDRNRTKYVASPTAFMRSLARAWLALAVAATLTQACGVPLEKMTQVWVAWDGHQPGSAASAEDAFVTITMVLEGDPGTGCPRLGGNIRGALNGASMTFRNARDDWATGCVNNAFTIEISRSALVGDADGLFEVTDGNMVITATVQNLYSRRGFRVPGGAPRELPAAIAPGDTVSLEWWPSVDLRDRSVVTLAIMRDGIALHRDRSEGVGSLGTLVPSDIPTGPAELAVAGSAFALVFVHCSVASCVGTVDETQSRSIQIE
jgi:hypothetical protein